SDLDKALSAVLDSDAACRTLGRMREEVISAPPGCQPKLPAAEAHAPAVDTVDWNLFREGCKPTGQLLTVERCEKIHGLTGPELSKAAKKDPTIRTKNPDGRGDVYRDEAVKALVAEKEEKEERRKRRR